MSGKNTSKKAASQDPQGWSGSILKFIGVLGTLGLFSYGWTWFQERETRWRKVDADINSLTLGIFAADKIVREPGSELPDQTADKLIKINFIRDSQQKRHSEAWKRLGSYIVKLDKNSTIEDWEKSVQGHRKIESMSHKNFVAFEYSSRSATILARYTADATAAPIKVNLPIQLLAYANKNIPEPIRRKWQESTEVPMYILPTTRLNSIWGQYPVVDLSRKDVQRHLQILGKKLPSNAVAVPAFNELSTDSLISVFPTNDEIEK